MGWIESEFHPGPSVMGPPQGTVGVAQLSSPGTSTDRMRGRWSTWERERERSERVVEGKRWREIDRVEVNQALRAKRMWKQRGKPQETMKIRKELKREREKKTRWKGGKKAEEGSKYDWQETRSTERWRENETLPRAPKNWQASHATNVQWCGIITFSKEASLPSKHYCTLTGSE